MKEYNTIDDKIRDEKLKHNINIETPKISALRSGKIDRYEYLTCEETLITDQGRMIEKDRFSYSSLEKGLEKQTKTIGDQETK